MDLFSTEPVQQLLPFDGEAAYYGPVMGRSDADGYYERLFNDIAWKNDEAKIFGKHFITKRKASWYGDTEYDYTYSNVTKRASIWTPDLLKLKNLVEALSETSYNSCLLNLYHDGSEGMAWHSDGEKTLAADWPIASLSFGAERKFSFKHKASNLKVDILLAHGSLLVMKGTCQNHWLHRLAPTKKVTRPRVNLTFRKIEL